MKGFEPLTVRLEGGCSIQLSYMDIDVMLSLSEAYFNLKYAMNSAKVK